MDVMKVKKYSILLGDEWFKRYSWSLNHHMIEWKCIWVKKHSRFLNYMDGKWYGYWEALLNP